MPGVPTSQTLDATTAIRQSVPEAALFNNMSALQSGISALNVPGAVTMVGLYTDSIIAGTQASDINTAAITRFRTKFLDIRNAKIGGSAKSGRGRFGPFHHNATGAVTGTAGPIIIGGSSGWVRSTSTFTNMFWTTLDHPGGVTPGAGTAYCGCYMAMSQTGLTGNACRWLGLLFNSSLTGVFRVQFRQGASVVSSGSTGTNRYTIVGGVPDPAVGGGDIKLDVTIDPTTSSYPDMTAFITGHLNSTTMDPTSIWQVCIYRTTNAATSVSISGFDAHYDEYTAQNTPSTYGATVVADFCCPGKSGQIFQGGASIFGTNADYEAQYTQDVHIDTHVRAYNKTSKFTHAMPTMKLAITNFWRNDVLNVDSISAMTPTQWGTRLKTAILAFAKVGVPLVQLCDFGASASYICAFPYFDQSTQIANDYQTQTDQAVSYCATLRSTQFVGGGGCAFRLDLAAGTGGPLSYVRRNFFSSGDNLHLNDAGQEWLSDILVSLCTNPQSIQPYNVGVGGLTTTKYETRSLTSRLGINKTTVLELDPHKYGSVRLSGGDGYYPIGNRHTDFGVMLHAQGAVPYDGTGITSYKLGQTKSGGATTIVINQDQFGQRAGLEFDNIAAGLTGITYDLSTLTWGGSQYTIFFITQNMRQSDLSLATNNQQHYWMFGTAADVAANPTSIYDSLSNERVLCGAVLGIYSGQMMVRVANQVPTVQVASTGTSNATPSPAREPILGCITFDCSTKQLRVISSPLELAATGWKTSTMDGTINSTWNPTRLTIGKLCGTGATGAPSAFGGMWVINGIVSDAEYTQIWNTLYAESGGFFETGTGSTNFGQAAGVIV